MHRLLLTVVVLTATADRTSDREALLAADRSLSGKTASLGLLQGFVPALLDGAAYLYPGAPLLRGADRVRAFLNSSDSVLKLTWTPAFADVSLDGQLGYTYGWTRSGATRGKYLACWRKTDDRWRIAAYATNRPVAVTDSVTLATRKGGLTAPVRGPADASELMRADSAFAALSVGQGAKAAFLAFAADEAMSFGGGTQFSEGREAIGAGFDGFPAGAVLSWWPLGAEIAQSGDLGCSVGEATIESLHHYSKYLTVWKRQQDGGWKFVADGGNQRPAP
ncbi:MAG TPA: hypothetical protein VEK83_02490 [Gemmatimonadales bacterium]|nr:hypothetical protein [Gemmatimonadales bacterium]